MRVLVIGGAGYVGGLVLPYLARHHDIRVFDLVKPTAGPWDHVIGSVEDMGSLTANLEGMDALVYMAMYTRPVLDDVTVVDPTNVLSAKSAFDVHAKGLYLALWAASACGVPHAVYTSSLSVYRPRTDHYPEDAAPPDASDLYGLTKRLGEEVCRSWAIESGITVTALRLCFPVPDDAPAPTEHRFKATTFTRAYDVAEATLAALRYRHGFSAFTISGDAGETMVSLRTTREELGWNPAHPVTVG